MVVNLRRRHATFGIGAFSLMPLIASWPALAARRDVQRLIEKISPKAPKKGRIALDLAPISEDGANVLIGFSVDSPMTENDHVKTVHLFAERNPNPKVASYHFTPQSGKAEVITKIRLAESQRVIALAVMTDGTAYLDSSHVKITIGGCGGGN